MRHICYGIIRYLRRRGHYPTKGELSRYLKAKMYAVHWYIDECYKEQILEKAMAWDKEIRITEKGWASLSVEPIMPTTRRKRRAQTWRAQIAANIAKQVIEMTRDA